MPKAEIKSKQAIYTLSQLHAELAGKFLENRRQSVRLKTAMTGRGRAADVAAGVQRPEHRREAPQQEQSMVQARDAV
jgi:hypothetical protein